MNITNNGVKLEEIPEKIENCILDFFYSVGIAPEEIVTETQNRWHGALMYTYMNVFKNNNYIYINPNDTNEYNYNIINGICDIYMYLCEKYNKISNYYGLSALLYISTSTILAWGSCKLNSTQRQIYEKLIESHERGLSDRLISAKNNPVGVLGALNHYYNWSMPNVRVQQQQQQALSVADLPKLGDSSADCTKQKILPDS